jgi:hypothetical protein
VPSSRPISSVAAPPSRLPTVCHAGFGTSTGCATCGCGNCEASSQNLIGQGSSGLQKTSEQTSFPAAHPEVDGNQLSSINCVQILINLTIGLQEVGFTWEGGDILNHFLIILGENVPFCVHFID